VRPDQRTGEDNTPWYAALAEKERRLIGERTRAALAERRKAGVRIGNPVNATEAAAHGRRIQIAEADRFAANLLPVIAALPFAGITDLRGLAAALNARGIPTARGGRWYVRTSGTSSPEAATPLRSHLTIFNRREEPARNERP
jgi:hypothetical protein